MRLRPRLISDHRADVRMAQPGEITKLEGPGTQLVINRTGPLAEGRQHMRAFATGVMVLVLALAPSAGRAELSADDRYFAAALEARLKSLELERPNCGAGVGTANMQGWQPSIGSSVDTILLLAAISHHSKGRNLSRPSGPSTPRSMTPSRARKDRCRAPTSGPLFPARSVSERRAGNCGTSFDRSYSLC